MSCAGLCRSFTLTRANRIVSCNAVGWQQGPRCISTSVNVLKKYHLERDDTHILDRYSNSLLHTRSYSSSSSSIFGYNSGRHGNTTEDWLHITKTLGTPSWGISPPCLPVLSRRRPPAVSSGRWVHSTSRHRKELAESDTKIESTVKHLKEAKKEKEAEEAQKVVAARPTPASPEAAEQPPKTVVLPKKSIMTRIKDEILHYWHGFRLLGLDIKVSCELLWRVLNGKNLTRREYRQFVRTMVDMLRLVPFLVFILIPFMEFLLPVAVKLFPNMLPSTFEDKSKKEAKMMRELALKLEMAKFIQDSIEDTPLIKRKSKDAKRAQEFANFISKIRTSGEQATNDEIVKFSKLFENELTLDNLSRDQLIALCRLLKLKPFGTNDFLRFQLRMQLRNLMLDDKMIDKEGVESLTTPELQAACQARGMRAIGVTVERLKSQLQQWLDLHLNEQIPTSLLLLSRALYLPDNLPVPDQLQATIASLPEKTASEAKIKLSELAGEKISNTERLAVIKEEDEVIHKEREMRRAEEREDLEKKRVEADAARDAKMEEMAEKMEEAQVKVAEEIAAHREVLIDTAPIIEQEPLILQYAKKPEIEDDVSKEDIIELKEAINQIAHDKADLLPEKEKMEELKEDISEYKEDLEDLRKEAEGFKDAIDIKETTTSTLLGKQVNRLMNRVENIVDELEKEKDQLEKKEVSLTADLRVQQEGLHEDRDHKEVQKIEEAIDSMRKDIISVEELMDSIGKITKVTDEVKLRNILREMDVNEDGHIDIGEVIKALDTISKEKVNLSTKQIGDIMDLLSKEETTEEGNIELGAAAVAAVADAADATPKGDGNPLSPNSPSSPPPTSSGATPPPPPPSDSDVKKTEEMKQ